MSSKNPYVLAFKKATKVFQRVGFRPALAALKRELPRQKMAIALNSSDIFSVGTVSVPHIDAGHGVLIVRTNSLSGTGHGASLRIAPEGYSVNGNPVEHNSPHYPRFAAIEREALVQYPRFGIPARQYKLSNGL